MRDFKIKKRLANSIYLTEKSSRGPVKLIPYYTFTACGSLCNPIDRNN